MRPALGSLSERDVEVLLEDAPMLLEIACLLINDDLASLGSASDSLDDSMSDEVSGVSLISLLEDAFVSVEDA